MIPLSYWDIALETACHFVPARHSTGESQVNPAPKWLHPKYIAPCGVFSSYFERLISTKGCICTTVRPVLVVTVELPGKAFITSPHDHSPTCLSVYLTVTFML